MRWQILWIWHCARGTANKETSQMWTQNFSRRKGIKPENWSKKTARACRKKIHHLLQIFIAAKTRKTKALDIIQVKKNDSAGIRHPVFGWQLTKNIKLESTVLWYDHQKRQISWKFSHGMFSLPCLLLSIACETAAKQLGIYYTLEVVGIVKFIPAMFSLSDIDNVILYYEFKSRSLVI